MSDTPKVRTAKITDFQPDPANANKGTERGYRVLDDSIRQFGGGRSILADRNGVLIAGNKTQEAAVDAGLEDVIVIETDGSKLVVVQRTDLDLSENGGRARQLAYVDNRAGQLSLNWDADQLLADLGAGMDFSGLWTDEEIKALLDQSEGGSNTAGSQDDTKYSREIKAPIYTPRGDKPAVDTLFDASRTQSLVDEIEATEGLTDDERDFLKAAAQRHTVLHFARIADFYAHSRPEVQRLMENSALVIIDFNRAIELGFVQLSERLAKLAGIDEDGD